MKAPKARQLPSGSWFCRVRVNGQDVSITAPTEKEAVAEAMAVKVGIIEKAAHPERGTLREAFDRYIESRSAILSPATIRGYRIIQKNRLQSIMDYPLCRITKNDVQRAINDDAAAYSPKSVKNSYGLLKSVLLDSGVSLDLSRVATPMKVDNEKPIYTREELEKLLAAIRGTDVEIPILLAAWLGLRRSEIIALKWSDVDFDRMTVSVHAARVQNEENEYVYKATKTTKSKRLLPCPAYIIDILRDAPRPSEYIVPASPQTIRNRMVRICEDAGIPFYGLHSLRHTNASVMLALNVADKYAMKRGGWSSKETMSRIYQHTMTEEEKRAAEAVDGYFGQLVAPKKPKRYRLSRSLPGEK